MRPMVMLLVCLLPGQLLVSAAEPTDGGLIAAAVREAARIAHERPSAQASGNQNQNKKSGGHPVLAGAAIGAGVGAAVGYFGSSLQRPSSR